TVASFELSKKTVTEEHLTKVQRALWEMESHMTWILNSEAARPYTDYIHRHTEQPDIVFTDDGRQLDPDTITVKLPSPIAKSGPPHAWIDLYFQVDQDGAVTSPQIEDDDEREKAHIKLGQILALCDLQTCRRAYLMEYLGESWPETDCGGCDICLLPREEFDATEIAQKVLSTAIRTGERFGVNYLVDVMRGAANKAVRTRGHHELSVFGIAEDIDGDELKEMVRSLVAKGLLAQQGSGYPTLAVSQQGRRFLNNREQLTLTRPKQAVVEYQARSDQGANGREQAYDTKLFDELAALRLEIATDREVPAYQIFGNKALQQMAFHMPHNQVEFSKISGVGDVKLREFSEPFLKVIIEYMQANGQTVNAEQARQRVPVTAPKKKVRGISMSIRETISFVAQGLSLEEVAEQRGITEMTVRSHLERFVQERGQIDLGHLMPSEAKRRKIEAAFEEMGEERLTPVRDMLGDDYTWEELAVVRMAMRQRQMQSEPVG
ncbi:MAG: RQC domain-containing protein, partial [Dehalococcoidia bacterium]